MRSILRPNTDPALDLGRRRAAHSKYGNRAERVLFDFLSHIAPYPHLLYSWFQLPVFVPVIYNAIPASFYSEKYNHILYTVMHPVNGAGLPTQARAASRNNGVIPTRTSPFSIPPAQAELAQGAAEPNGTATAMPVDAYKNNERLFPVLKNGLSDENSYVVSAAKLASWLSVSKAFYTAARPWVSLLSL